MKRIAFGSTDAPPMPTKIVAVGRNYREHAKELGNIGARGRAASLSEGADRARPRTAATS